MGEQTPARRTNKRDFATLMNQSLTKFESIIPTTARKFLTPERVISLAVNAFSKSAALQECEPISILNAVITSVQLGFEPNGPLGHAYLVPYKGIVQLQIGYKGFTDLARRTGDYELIDSRVIYANDVFTLRYDPAPVFNHDPTMGVQGEMTHVYSYAYMRGSSRPIFEMMTKKDVEQIRASARSKDSPAWTGFWGEMAKKCCLKRMLKDQPLSIELATALAYDNAVNAMVERRRVAGGNAGLMRQLGGGDEPSFAAGEGVAVPLRTEDDDEHNTLDRLAAGETVPN
jgi:recombination protein RecT